MANDHDRIVHIEAQLEVLQKESAERTKAMAKLDSRLDTLNLELSRYRGAVGGVLLVVTALVTFFKLFGGAISEKFQ